MNSQQFSMNHYQINSQHLIGFATGHFKQGELAKVITKVSKITSDDSDFHEWISQIYNLFFAPKKIIPSTINTFLILLHHDDTADVYINTFNQTSSIKVNREVKAGDEIYEHDVLDISNIEFPDIEIKTDDAIIYSVRYSWKFGLYFDFQRKLDLQELSKELANLFKVVGFKHLIEIAAAEIKRSSQPVFIVTEGKTDWQHIENARSKLGLKIGVDFHKSTDDRGDTTLFEMCKHFAITDHGKILIFIFDRDNPSILKELKTKTVNGKQFQDWGNDVYSFPIPIPEHRKIYENISIEFYYKDEEIRTKDSNGKRIFFDNELELRKREGEKAIRVEIQPVATAEVKKKIYAQDVSQIINLTTGEQIALSKSNFAQNILTQVEGFNNFDVSEFNKIFAIIKEITEHSSLKSM